ncbi:MAG: dephospho-CoA kinase [Clostridiales bacterium]|nr:dephospho-CoA kinase [Clostridiales bacterium]
MRIIGVTGGVGAGKSAVLACLEEEFDALVIQADHLGHVLMEPGEECYEPVLDLFGKNVLNENKRIDRRRVSDVVFSREDMRRKLDDIIHPAVRKRILRTLGEAEAAGRSLCAVEAALLLEDNYQDFCDEIWYVYAEEEIRIRRLKAGRGYTREKAASIIKRQMPDSFFRAHADYIVENNGEWETTLEQIREGIRRNETL